jgi:hypothetical protein
MSEDLTMHAIVVSTLNAVTIFWQEYSTWIIGCMIVAIFIYFIVKYGSDHSDLEKFISEEQQESDDTDTLDENNESITIIAIVHRVVSDQEGVGLRVVLPDGRHFLLYAIEDIIRSDAFPSMDIAELRLLESGDTIEVTYFLPTPIDVESRRTILMIGDWKVVALTQQA